MRETESRIDGWFDMALIGVFAVAIFVSFAVIVFETDPVISGSEKRILAEWPGLPRTFKAVEEFPQRFNAYADDRFGLRSTFLHLDCLLKWRLGLQISPKVLTGKDGWLFLGEHSNVVDQHRGIDRFEGEDLHRWVSAMVERQEWLAERSIPFIVVVAPNKHSIYPEYLPKTIGPVVGETRLDQLVDYIKEHTDLDFIDLRGPVLEAKESGIVFFKTDSHWNDVGGFAGYRELVKRIKRYCPEVGSVTLNDYSRQLREWKGDLVQMLNLQGVVSEYASALIPKHPTPVCLEMVFGPGGSEVLHRMYCTTLFSELPTVVIFHDSSIWGMFKFLYEGFHRTIMVPHSVTKFDTALIEKEKPDIVIYELIERAVGA